MQQGPGSSFEKRLASAWRRLQQGPEDATELWLVRVCGSLVIAVISTTEMVFTLPGVATFARHLGLPVVVPSQPIGYIGGFNAGLLLAVIMGAVLGYATGHGVYRYVWRSLHRHG